MEERRLDLRRGRREYCAGRGGARKKSVIIKETGEKEWRNRLKGKRPARHLHSKETL